MMRWMSLLGLLFNLSLVSGQSPLSSNGYLFLTQNDSTAFFLFEEHLCWQDAQSEFEMLGGHLATFTSLEENILVWESAIASSPNTGVNPWIGLIQVSNQDEPAGNWTWVTGEILSFENWAPLEPNNIGNEDYGMFSGHEAGSWNDHSSCGPFGAILEIPLQFVGCLDASACNFNGTAIINDGSCDYSSCFCLTGTLWDENLGGCVPNPTICSEGTYWDEETQSCLPDQTCPQDLNYDGIVGTDDLLVLLSTFGFPCQPEIVEWACGEPVTYHGYDYQTVLIGEQCWFAEDLRATLFRNGEEIDFVENVSYEVQNSVLPVYAQNEIEGNGDFGNLYNLYSVIDERGLCPQQWSVSTPEHWEVLTSYIESNYTVLPGAALKSEIDWIGTPSIDLFGFNAKPGGYYGQGYCFYGHQANSLGIWWTTGTEDTATNFYLVAGDGALNSTLGACVPGFCASVRCVKD